MKKKYYYLLIMIIMFSLVVSTKGFNMFGSLTDWYNQHIVFLDIIKRVFLSSNNYLVPYIGGITNIFSISYYGLFNPLYIPYLFINISPELYMSYLYMFMYIVIGISTFAYLNTKYDDNKSLLGTILVITASPILFHLHRQVMFVNYLPFLLLGLYAIDKEKKWVLSISVLLIGLTSFFYLIPSVLVLIIYYLYRKEKKNIKKNLVIPIIFGILSSMFLLLPTFINLVSNRLSMGNNNLLMLLPNVTLNSILYDPYSLGITILVLFVLYMGLFNKDKKVKYLSITLLVIFLIGLSSFLMNGMLYARSKVLIPFIYLVIIQVLDNIDSIKKIDIKYICLFFILLIISFIAVYLNTKYKFIFIFEVLLLILYLVLNNKDLLKYSIVVTALISCFITNFKSDYPDYINPFDNDINNLIENVSINDRVSILVDKSNNYNSRYNINTSSIYSSSINKYYYKFIRNYLDLDESGENYLMINPSSNIIYNTYMSNKYIIDYKNKNYLGYDEIQTSGELSLYKNDKVLPIMYGYDTTNTIGLYNLEEYSISSLKDNYDLSLDKGTFYNIKLDEELNNRILVIKFNINSTNKERIISINDEINKISRNKWVYYNHNEEFTYYISEKSLKELNIYLSEGDYKLSNIKTYIINYDDVNNMVNMVSKGDNILIENDTIKGNISMDKDGYLITNIPYDKDYIIYIDGNKKELELVNDYFIGSRLEKGEHSIEIKYTNKWFIIGIIISIMGVLGIIIKEKEK